LVGPAGGILLITGLLTPLAGVALAIDMLVAGLTAHTGKGFFVQDGGYELVLLLGAGSLSLALAGAGRFSADALVLRGEDGPGRRRRLRALAQQ
jgi:putative oxidoreductase